MEKSRTVFSEFPSVNRTICSQFGHLSPKCSEFLSVNGTVCSTIGHLRLFCSAFLSVNGTYCSEIANLGPNANIYGVCHFGYGSARKAAWARNAKSVGRKSMEHHPNQNGFTCKTMKPTVCFTTQYQGGFQIQRGGRKHVSIKPSEEHSSCFEIHKRRGRFSKGRDN